MYYVVFCGLSDSTKLSSLFHKRHDFREEADAYKTCVMILCTNLSKKYYYKKNSARYYHKYTQVFTYRIRYSGHVLIKLDFSLQVFEKSSHIKLHENSSSAVELFRKEWRTDSWTDMTPTVAFLSFSKTSTETSTKHPQNRLFSSYQLYLMWFWPFIVVNMWK